MQDQSSRFTEMPDKIAQSNTRISSAPAPYAHSLLHGKAYTSIAMFSSYTMLVVAYRLTRKNLIHFTPDTGSFRGLFYCCFSGLLDGIHIQFPMRPLVPMTY
jgi:hypothetical protein